MKYDKYSLHDCLILHSFVKDIILIVMQPVTALIGQDEFTIDRTKNTEKDRDLIYSKTV